MSETIHTLTPNRRLAAELLEYHAESQQNTAFSTPVILPFDAWLQLQYLRLCEVGHVDFKILPTPLQEALALQKIIENSTAVISFQPCQLISTAQMTILILRPAMLFQH